MKAGLMAPMYLSISWVLTVSYQLLTDTAVRAISSNIAFLWPGASGWLNSNIETIVFVYAFTWIFVLSSVIPSAIVGNKRGFLSQYLVVLSLSLLAFFMPDILLNTTGIQISQIISGAVILQNPVVAIIYLSIPYLFMIGIDWRSKVLANRKETEGKIAKYNQMTRSQAFKLAADEEGSTQEDSEQAESRNRAFHA
jgi:hypothetical protein